jgi:hypothetical protein
MEEREARREESKGRLYTRRWPILEGVKLTCTIF